MVTIFKRIWIIIFSLPLFLGSCQQQSGKEGPMLRLNFQEGDIPTLHPHLVEGYVRGRIIGKALFEGLTRINSEGEIELAGAKSIEISPSQTQYTFTLRDHQWSDGTAVTAFQYEKAWKQAIVPTSECTRADLFYTIQGAKEVKRGSLSLDDVGIKAVNEKTLSIKLAFPAPYFLKLIALPIFSPVEKTVAEPSRFNGPFVVDKWKKNDVLLLKANPYFWDRDQISIKEIEIQMVTDPSTAFLMYEKQKLDWIGSPFCKLTSEIVTQLQKRNELQQQPIAQALWLHINTRYSTLVSAKIRQALSSAIDRSLITEHIFPPNTPLYTPIPLSLSLCPNIRSDNKLLQSKLLFEEGLKEIQLPRQDFPLLILSYSPLAGRKSLAEYLKETWEKVLGIKVHLKVRVF